VRGEHGDVDDLGADWNVLPEHLLACGYPRRDRGHGSRLRRTRG
jgi:hypothetical protein